MLTLIKQLNKIPSRLLNTEQETERDGARLAHVPLCSSLCRFYKWNSSAHLWVRQVQSLCRCRWLVVLWARVEPVLVVINFCSTRILRDICTRTATTSTTTTGEEESQATTTTTRQLTDRIWPKTLKIISIRQNKDMQDDREETFVCSILVINGLKIHDHAQSPVCSQSRHQWLVEPETAWNRSWGWGGLQSCLQITETPPYHWVEMFSVLL